MQVHDRNFDSNGVPIHFLESGEGAPVILVHGYLMDAYRNWVKPRDGQPGLLTQLAAERRVIGLDSRGHGESGCPRDPSRYGIEMVYDVLRLLDYLAVERVDIVGYSDGGDITLKLLAVAPERVATATLCASGGIRPAVNLEESRRFGMLVAESLEQGEGLRSLLLDLVPPGSPLPDKEWLARRSRRLLAGQDSLALAMVARGWAQWAVADEELRDCRTPMLAVAGMRDPALQNIEALAKLLPHIKIVRIYGADHIQTFSHPRFYDAVIAFIRRRSE